MKENPSHDTGFGLGYRPGLCCGNTEENQLTNQMPNQLYCIQFISIYLINHISPIAIPSLSSFMTRFSGSQVVSSHLEGLSVAPVAPTESSLSRRQPEVDMMQLVTVLVALLASASAFAPAKSNVRMVNRALVSRNDKISYNTWSDRSFSRLKL